MGSPGCRPSDSQVYARDSVEFGRALAFIDAIFGFSATLLVTNLDLPSGEQWRSPGTLLGGRVGDQLLSFAISFVVIAGFWRLNHAVIARFEALDSAVITAGLVVAGLVVLIPFTTQGIGDPSTSELALPTALYAGNVALVVAASAVLLTLAWRRGLIRDADTDRRAGLAGYATTMAVFLVSIPIAYGPGPDAAQLSWLSLVVLGPVADRLVRR